MKIVINTCFGGFGLSGKAYERLIELGIPVQKYAKQSSTEEVIFDRTLSAEDCTSEITRYGKYWEMWIDRYGRANPLVIKVVEELGEEANGESAQLKIVEIPDGTKWHIQDYNGIEHVAEVHRTWD